MMIPVTLHRVAVVCRVAVHHQVLVHLAVVQTLARQVFINLMQRIIVILLSGILFILALLDVKVMVEYLIPVIGRVETVLKLDM